jgi:GPN-loop GTPase
MSETVKTKQPATVICIGMAGSGKTTFMQRLNSHLHSKKTAPYVINLDPAVLKVPFGTNIDIRDSVNYKKVMKDYGLGPNGAIMTSLNLFATKIDQVLNIVEKRAPSVDHIIIDTPGQIECFIWSASGAIITDALASSLPTIVAYIVDTPRTTSPTTFMSNMLYACSILYKTKLPMVVVFNKTDAQDSKFAEEWMEDFELFQKALREDEDLNGEGENGSGYMGSLMNSLSLMLEEFYRHLDVVSVSAYTGKGFDEFLDVIDKKVEEYNKDYKAERDRIVKERAEEAARQKTQSLTKLMKDIGIKDKKDLKNAGADQVDALSDTEDVDEEGAGEIIRDEDEPQREYTFEDRTEAGIQARYREALEQSQGDTKELEKMLEGIDRS